MLCCCFPTYQSPIDVYPRLSTLKHPNPNPNPKIYPNPKTVTLTVRYGVT